jgi:UDP-glucose 4-epimerase
MKHVLVTGGNGFIGGHVVRALKSRDLHVIVLERHEGHVFGMGMETESYFGDIKDAVLVDDAISHVDGVIHLAGVLGTQETVADPTPAAVTNILGGLNVITACAKYDVPLVNIAVGNFWMDNTYSITKNAVERFVNMKKTFEGKMMTSVRALNAYGPGQVPSIPYGPSRVRKIMPAFICRALAGDPIEIYGDGSQVMDMIFVKDVAEILVRTLISLDENGPPERIIEAGTGRHTTVNDIANTVIAAVGQGRIEHLPMRPGEPEHSVVVGNPETLLQIGMTAFDLRDLESGTEKTVNWLREYLS